MARPTGKTIFRWRAAAEMALSRLTDQAAANSCSGLVPIRAEPGVESLMSRKPSELRDAPYSRPPVVPVLAVWSTLTIWLMAHSFLQEGPRVRRSRRALRARADISG